ncbi:MAG: hypothetical protein F4X49_07390 [Acidimicrobiia bacterium]|nr:hypothetical protein [Acidimicrobiia bacterium]
MVANGPVAVLTSAASRNTPVSTGRTDEAGSAALEFVVLVPVLTLLVLFLLWAGGTGHARLAADLAAEEAATAAALCCGSDDDERREFVVEAILSGKPELSRLCVAPPRPLEDRYVSQSSFPFTTADGVPSGGVGVLSVGFGCETDGGVGVPGTIFPSSEIRGRATEVLLLPPGPALDVDTRPVLTVADARTNERFEALTFVLELDRPVAPNRDISVFYRLNPFDGADPDSDLNAEPATTTDDPFDFCNATIDEILHVVGDYDPSAHAASHRDYLQTTGRVRIPRGETTATIRVPILDDCLHENLEHIELELYNENEADVLVATRRAVGTIVSNDDLPLVAFLDTVIEVGEAPPEPTDRSQHLPLELTLRNASSPHHRTVGVLEVTGELATVDDVLDTASAVPSGLCPADYTALGIGQAGSAFSISRLEAGDAVGVEILDDDVHEGPEQFTVRLEQASGAALGSDRVVRVVITDDDDPPRLGVFDGTLGSATELVVDEGAGVLALDVRLLNADGHEIGNGVPVTFTYDITGGTATVGVDYNEDIPELGWTIEPCASGSSLYPGITVEILDDDIPESDEEFFLVLDSAETENALDSEAITVTILDDD